MLSPIESRFDDVWREERNSHYARDVGRDKPLLLGELRHIELALAQDGPPPA